MKKFLFAVLLAPTSLFAQIDSLKGKIRSIREQLIFLDSTKQNLKLFSTEGDYGHDGFIDPEYAFAKFNKWWFHTPWVHYLNYEKNYDTAKNLKEEIWYLKNGKVRKQLKYDYDENNNLIRINSPFHDSPCSVTKNNYNQLKQLITSLSYSCLGKIIMSIQFTFIMRIIN